MASKSTAGKGAAEEPEPELGPSSSTPSSYEYDPSAYQPPHPDDVGRGGGGGDGKPTKKVQAKGKAKGKAKAKGKDDGTTHRCGNCDAPNAKSKCMRCCVEHYCGHECQKVRGGAAPTRIWVASFHPAMAMHSHHPHSPPHQEHWRYGGHKKACPAYVLAAAAHSQQVRLCKAAFEAD